MFTRISETTRPDRLVNPWMANSEVAHAARNQGYLAKNSHRVTLMSLSLEEAIPLLHKWKANRASVILCFSSGRPHRPLTFFSTLTGTLTEVSACWAQISARAGYCRLRLDVPGTHFEQVETWDRKLLISAEEPEVACRLSEGNLSVSWPDGSFCVLTALREGGGLNSDHESISRP